MDNIGDMAVLAFYAASLLVWAVAVFTVDGRQ